MGYTTEFIGRMKLSKKLTDSELIDYHNNWLEPRHTIHDDKYTTGREDAPSIWLKWNICEVGGEHYLEWTEQEKFYGYYAWLELIIKEFLTPKGIYLQGKIRFSGEDVNDCGIITAHIQTTRQKGGDEEEWRDVSITILKIYNVFNELDWVLDRISKYSYHTSVPSYITNSREGNAVDNVMTTVFN